LHENANHIDNNIKKSNFYYGATFVPLKVDDVDEVDEVDEEDEEDEEDKDNNE
jgi:hypothetical protein